MTKVFNLGSINMDQIVRVGHFPQPGETISGTNVGTNLGGKGLNVSVALARAGVAPIHIGAIGADDEKVAQALSAFEIDTAQIKPSSFPGGSAFVFLDQTGENSIVVCPGANQEIDPKNIEEALSTAQPGDWLTLQNETNAQIEAAKMAKARGMKVAYMAAPFDAEKIAALEGLVDLLAVNETEAAQLEAFSGKPITDLGFPAILVTLGAKGAKFTSQGQEHRVQGREVEVVDTTAAGDTFFGYFLAEFLRTNDPVQSLQLANIAASLAVQSEGAASSIPRLRDVLAVDVE